MKNSCQYHWILLDADDTLFDFQASSQAAFAATVQGFGLSYSPELFSLYQTINHALWEAFAQGEVTKEDLQTLRFQRFFQKAYPNSQEPLSPVQWNQRYLENLSAFPLLLPGALELCQVLSQQAVLAIVTNGIGVHQRKRLAKSPLKPYLHRLFISEEVGVPKPDPQYFHFVFQSLQKDFPDFSLEKTILLGDSLATDILGGNRAGIHTCWFNPRSLPPDPQICPSFEIRRLEEFLPIVL